MPKPAPPNWPNISKIPFVRVGAIGKVNSCPKFIEQGIIGTKEAPNKPQKIQVGEKCPSGRMIPPKIKHRNVEKQTTRIVIRYFEVF